MDQTNSIAIFRTVKPACVRLSDDALKLLAGRSNAGDVVSSTENLLNVLQGVLRNGPSIDERLVNYIFFPLSHMFKDKDKFPARAIELGLECLLLLFRSGWQQISDPNLALQLLIFLTIIADNEQAQGSNTQAASTELKSASLRCISQLFQSLKDSRACKDALANTTNLPAVGHAVTVLLNSLKGQTPRDIQVPAIEALYKFCTKIATLELLRNFLPGIFSTFSHVLVPTVKERRPYVVLEKGLSTLAYMTGSLLSDEKNIIIHERLDQESSENKAQNSAWLKATAAQTKLVFANVIKLRDHERLSVRSALLELCWVVLGQCQTSLKDSIPLILETTIYLISRDDLAQATLRFQHLVLNNHFIRESARSLVYEASTSLPRILSSNDEDAKTRQTQQILTVLNSLYDSNTTTTFIDETLQRSLTESLNSVFETTERLQPLLSPSPPSDGTKITLKHLDDQVDLRSLLSTNGKAGKALENLQTLANGLSQSEGALLLARDSLMKVYNNEAKLANLWICFNILQSRARRRQEIDAYLVGDTRSDQEIAVRNELYAIAVTHLSSSGQEQGLDWRTQALALEVVAFEATEQKNGFRPELVDTLYAVVHHLGSPVQPLRSLAMKCLDTIATSCGYSDAKDLVVSNVDYLVNAVGLKLNTMDISPQMPQVLLMMIKLSGPSLLPYLEDLIDGIFEALECYHGYPLLVEQLFSVLNGAVEEGVKASPFKSQAGEFPSHRKTTRRPQTMEDLAYRISKRQERETAANKNEIPIDEQNLPLNTPHRPWKELRKTQDEDPTVYDESGEDDSKNDDKEAAPPPETREDKRPLLSSTYKMLQTISTQTQHHLPSSSPAIRISLLSLLSTALPFLSQHDDTLLPLIHTLWPVLVPRLDDKEAFVVEGVLNVMSKMCEGAGDFMSSRIEDLWPTIRKVHARCVEASTLRPRTGKSIVDRESLTRLDYGQQPLPLTSPLIVSPSSPQSEERTLGAVNKRSRLTGQQVSNAGSTDAYVSTTSRTIREALTNFLVSVLTNVRISQTIYEEILHEMLYEELIHGQRADVREALATLNADAVWFILRKTAWTHVSMESTENVRVFGFRPPIDVEGGPGFITA